MLVDKQTAAIRHVRDHGQKALRNETQNNIPVLPEIDGIFVQSPKTWKTSLLNSHQSLALIIIAASPAIETREFSRKTFNIYH